MGYKVLLVHDDPQIIVSLRDWLEKEGFSVASCSGGNKVVERAAGFLPHVIILDVVLSDIDGIETCVSLRDSKEFDDCAIVFVTERSEDYTQISALDAGADDYLIKPIKPRVLISRLKALIRRFELNAMAISYHKNNGGNFKIDKEKFIVVRDGNKINLPKKEFELLEYLASKPGKVFTREEIFNTIWDGGTIIGNRTIDVHIRKLRKKIGNKQIKTIKGIGYKLVVQ